MPVAARAEQKSTLAQDMASLLKAVAGRVEEQMREPVRWTGDARQTAGSVWLFMALLDLPTSQAVLLFSLRLLKRFRGEDY